MDSKDLKLRPDIESKPIDELGSLEDQLEDLMFSAEHAAMRRQRFALVIDATSSMGVVWAKAKDALRDAVDTIKAQAAVPVQISIVAYRDHEVEQQEYVVEASEWSDDTDYLHEYIKNMECFGGGDYPESVGHGLAWLKHQQTPVNQIILIGDAPSKPGSYGYAEAQWFGQSECPIYAIYTQKEPRLVSCFEKLAKLSGGKAFYLGNLKNIQDIFTVLLTSNKALQITYKPTSEEGRRLATAVQG